MTKAELRAEVFRRLRESTTSPVMWRDTDIDASVNEGLMEISDATEWLEEFIAITLEPYQAYYNLNAMFAGRGFLVSGPAFSVNTNRWLIPITPRQLDHTDLHWEQRISTPDHILNRGIWWVGYWPVPRASGETINQYAKTLPPELAETDEPEFPAQFHYALVEFALFDLFAQDAEADLAWEAWKAYIEYEKGLKRYFQNRIGVPLLRGFMEATP